MTVQFSPEQEQLIESAIAAGVIHTPNDVVEIGIDALRQRLNERNTEAPIITAEQWSREFHAWVHSHPTDTPLLSDEAISRDSIYGTRGM